MDILKSTRVKVLVVACMLLFGVALALTSGPKTSLADNNRVVGASPAFDGASDYTAQCARCHGGDGRGQTPKGKKTRAGDLTKSVVSDAKGIKMITNGSGEMPAYKDSMSAEQIRQVMGFVRGFRR